MRNDAYLAGIVDGEGSFYAYPRTLAQPTRVRLRLIVSNTSLALMTWLHENYGGYIEVNRTPGDGYARNKVLYRWMLHRQAAAPIVRAVLPYLVVKRQEADAWLRLEQLIGVRGNGAERIALVREIKALKRAA